MSAIRLCLNVGRRQNKTKNGKTCGHNYFAEENQVSEQGADEGKPLNSLNKGFGSLKALKAVSMLAVFKNRISA
jgi:hypothetical protein